jgi:hypothetical protein
MLLIYSSVEQLQQLKLVSAQGLSWPTQQQLPV